MIQFKSLPVYPLRIISKFGPRNTGIAGASTNHKGIDLGRDKSKTTTDILAVDDGIIYNNYWNKFKGWVIIVQHNGYQTLYQHLANQSTLKKGVAIKAGQKIGIMGNSSDTSVLKVAVHLHFELIVNGKQEDPEKYLLNIKQEDDEVVDKTKIEINGNTIEVDRILKDGNNYVQLKDIVAALGHTVIYDSVKKIPVIITK